MKNILLTGLLCAFCAIATQAQSSWQWGKRGGSSVNESSLGADEQVIDMATDPKGNVYVLSTVYANSNDININGNSILGRGSRDIVLSSFRCDGTHRWSKLFGANQNDMGAAVETDSLGGVYIIGRLFYSSSGTAGYFSNDTTLAASPRAMFLVKYDTAGTYKWLRRPQADTAFVVSNPTTPLDMDVDGAGNIYWLCALAPSVYVDGTYPVSSHNLHVLRYNRDGLFQGGTALDVTTTPIPTYYRRIFFRRNHSNGKMYLSGYATGSGTGTLSFGATLVDKSIFLGSFSASGNSVWVRQNTLSGAAGLNGSLSRVSLDPDGNLYLSGNAQHGDAFLGTTFTNLYSSLPYKVALAMKLDTAGNPVWIRNSSNLSGLAGDNPTSCFNGADFILADGYNTRVKWTGLSDSVSRPGGPDYDFFTTHFNAATGIPNHIDSLSSGAIASMNLPTAVTADKNGNVYFGGKFQSSITVNGAALTALPGGYRDFFIAKYGSTSCGCTIPTASYGKTIGANRTVTFNYFGAVTGLDSLVWDWGDGTRLKVMSNFGAAVTHVYGGSGLNFTACVTAYNACGASNQSCQAITFTATNIEGVAALGNIAVYPNPTTDILTIEGTEAGTSYTVLSLVGQVVQRGNIQIGGQTLSLGALPAGTYVLLLTNKDGVRGNMRITKQ